MKKLTLVVFIVLLFGGSLLAYYGQQKESSLMFGGGLAAAGAGVVVLGTDTIIRRESVEEDDAGYVTTYRGCSAIFVGVLWVLVGIIVSMIGLIALVRQQKFMIQWLTEHPGLALVAIGLVLLAFGGGELLGAEEQRGSFLVVLGSLPARFFGLMMILTGLVLLASGVLEILFPVAYQGVIAAIQLWWKDLQCQIQPALCDY